MQVLSERRVLPARVVGQPTAPFRVLAGAARCPTWWLLEIDSESARPCEAEVGWGGAGSSTPPIRVTVPTSTRLSFFGVAFDVCVANLAGGSNTVAVRALPVEGPIRTQNVYVVNGEIEVADAIPVWQPIPIPRFAKAVRVDLLTEGAAGVRLRGEDEDPPGPVLAAWPIAGQPAGGIPLGGESQLELYVEASARYRAAFLLHL